MNPSNKKSKGKKAKVGKDTIDSKSFIAELIVEEYRFLKSYASAVNKLYPEERQKYLSAYEFHCGKIKEFAEKARIGIGNFEGKDYDEGLPITPLNLDEFTKEDELIIEQTIEPSIIDLTSGKILKCGSAILAKKPKMTEEAVEAPLTAESVTTQNGNDANNTEGENK